jgi:hypothetical protein
MSDEQPKRSTEADAELEREIRAGREFSLAEAIGRMAGPGAMKGVSPIDRKRQAIIGIEEYLNRHLCDASGILPGVLLRQVTGSELLLKDFNQPLDVLASYIRLTLDSDYRLKELVREADVEWGRLYRERPFFENDGCSPNPDDPYTLESVRSALTQLVEKLTVDKS